MLLRCAEAASNSKPKQHVNRKIENTFRLVLFGEFIFGTFARCYLYRLEHRQESARTRNATDGSEERRELCGALRVHIC